MTALRSGSATDVGRVRTTNQDVALEDPDLYAVADGMGGHVGGDVAARVAVDALRSSFQRQPSVEGLRRAFAEANRAVWHQSQSEHGLAGMGTTLTAVALVRTNDGNTVVALANVGDSRAYVWSGGEVIQVTSDHSLAEEKVRQGELTAEQAAVHPHRHILTRVLGVSPDVDVDLWELRLREGDRVLLCSDGLTNEVTDDKIAELLSALDEPYDAARALVKAAVDHGGSDNVTVVVVDVVADDAAAGNRTLAVDGMPASLAGAGKDGGDGSAAAADQLAGKTARTPGRLGAAATAGAASVTGAARGTLLTADPVTSAEPIAPDGNGPEPRGTVAPPPLLRAPPHRLTRRERRRALGIPRMVTVRVILFLILVAAVVYGAYALVRWYANDDWYVAVHQGHLAVYQGRPSGFLWFKPRLLNDTPVTTKEILPVALPTVRAKKQEPSAAAARRYIANLHQEFIATQKLGNGVTPNAPAGAPAAGTTGTFTPATPAAPATPTTSATTTTTTAPVAG